MLTSSFPAVATSYISDDGVNWTQVMLPALNAGANESYLTVACMPATQRAVVFTTGTGGNRVFYSS
ncbi:hypothetical protein ACV229_34155 [Burkholderia sp. MR1-5-21]